jgi:hypothetical protein
MMAELIVTKKEIAPQLKKSAGTSRARPKSPGAGGQRLPLAGRNRAEHWILWFRGSGVLLAAGFAASVWTPVEGKIGTYTAAWTRGTQGHPQDRRYRVRQQSGHAGFDIDCGASEQPGALGEGGCGERMVLNQAFNAGWVDAIQPSTKFKNALACNSSSSASVVVAIVAPV